MRLRTLALGLAWLLTSALAFSQNPFNEVTCGAPTRCKQPQMLILDACSNPPQVYVCGGTVHGTVIPTPSPIGNGSSLPSPGVAQVPIGISPSGGSYQPETFKGDATIGPDGTVTITNIQHTYAASTPQIFPSVLPNPDLVVQTTVGDIGTTGPIGGLWINLQGLGGNDHIDWWDGNFSHQDMNEQDSICEMADGCSGSGQVVKATGGSTSGLNMQGSTFDQLIGNPKNFDQLYFYYNSSNVGPGFSASSSYSPLAHFSQVSYSDSTPPNGTAAGGYLLGESDDPQFFFSRTVVWGTVAMPVGSIANGACATGTVTVTGGSVTNVKTTDYVTLTLQGSPSSGQMKFGQPIISAGSGTLTFSYCNLTGASTSASAATYNFGVIR